MVIERNWNFMWISYFIGGGYWEWFIGCLWIRKRGRDWMGNMGWTKRKESNVN